MQRRRLRPSFPGWHQDRVDRGESWWNSADLRASPLQSLDAKALDGTEQVLGAPFWTHDSRHLVFTSGGKLRKIEASGGPAQLLIDEPVIFGGFSTTDGQLIYATPNGGIRKCPQGAGLLPPLGIRRSFGRVTHPSPLPNGKEFLFVVPTVREDIKVTPGIYIASLDGGEPRRILPDYLEAFMHRRRIRRWATFCFCAEGPTRQR